VFQRGAPCGAAMSTPITGDATTTYSPGCGMADCPTCGTTSGLPMEGLMGGGYIVDPQYPTPEP
jgi:hypothetical protein